MNPTLESPAFFLLTGAVGLPGDSVRLQRSNGSRPVSAVPRISPNGYLPRKPVHQSLGSDKPRSTSPSPQRETPSFRLRSLKHESGGRGEGEEEEDVEMGMHSFGNRANAFVTFAVTILAVMCSLASLSDNFNVHTPTADVKVSDRPLPFRPRFH